MSIEAALAGITFQGAADEVLDHIEEALGVGPEEVVQFV
jgi:hypothetical protein